MPDALKALRGNPGKRRLALDSLPLEPQVEAAPPVEASVTIPDWLTQDRERKIFETIVGDFLHRNIAKGSDVYAYARYAATLNRWIEAKLALDGKLAVYQSESPHGTYWRRHPLSTEMSILDGRMIALEDRLGLNPIARQTIIRNLTTLPQKPPGELFEQPDDDGSQGADDDEGPLNYVGGGSFH